MEDRTEDHGKMNVGIDNPMTRHGTNPVYETSLSQSSDASFQLNRLLNFNVAKGQEVEPDDQRKKLLNFNVSPKGEDMNMFIPNKKQRPIRDPMSHRIIEKRRRDRMNNCLADLSQLIPSPYLKQGQGRIEKTEIIEMAIKHIRQIQNRLNALGNDTPKTCCKEKFCQGYEECRENIMRYLMESLGFQPAETQNMYKYLENQLEKRKTTIAEVCTCKGASGSNGNIPAPSATTTASGAQTMLPPLEPIQMDTDSQPQTPSSFTPKSGDATTILKQPQQQHQSMVAESPSLLPSPGQQQQNVYEAHQQQMSSAPSSQQPSPYGSAEKRPHSTSETHSNFSAPPLERRASVPPPNDGRMHPYLPDNNRPSVSASPAVSDTSITPLVGEEVYLNSEGQLISVSNQGDVNGHQKNAGQYSDSGVYNSSSYNTDTSQGGGPLSVRQDSVGDGGGKGGYKFKNDIKWRFSADAGDKPDVKGEMSRDVEKEEFKDPPLPPHSQSQSVCSGDSISDSSNGNGSGGGSSGNNGDRSSISTGYSSNSGNSSNSSMDTSLTNTVPAFALHPMGVYYIPLVLPVSQVMPFMKNHRSMGICHPISIPVSFTGPFHMGIPQVNSNMGGNGGSYGVGDNKGHHRRHGNATRRSHGDNRNAHHRGESRSVHSSTTS